jgi:hypothetical protein
VANLRDVFALLAAISSWCHFTGIEGFCGYLLATATMKRTCLHVDRYCCTICNKFVIFGQVLIEVPKVKFHITSSSWIPSDKCGQTDRQTDGQGETNGCFHDCTRGTKLHGSFKLNDSMELYFPPLIVLWSNEQGKRWTAHMKLTYVREENCVHTLCRQTWEKGKISKI